VELVEAEGHSVTEHGAKVPRHGAGLSQVREAALDLTLRELRGEGRGISGVGLEAN
jgi:hypothetical protein